MLARKYVGVVKKLEKKTSESDSVEKLLVDVLKECSRHLASDADANADAPVIVQLVHNVPRPER